MHDSSGQSCRAQISCKCFICNRVIIQKSIFRILHGYSIFLAMSFRVSNAQYSEILNYQSSLYMLSIIGFSLSLIFWSILGELVCMQHIDNSTIDSLSRTTSYHAGFYTILWISTLWISRDFISFASQSERSIIDYLTRSDHFILFRIGQFFEVLGSILLSVDIISVHYGTVRGYI